MWAVRPSAGPRRLVRYFSLGCLAVLVGTAVLVGPSGVGPWSLPLAAEGPLPEPPPVPVDPERVVELYRRLEDPDEAARDRAYRTLLRMGPRLREHHFWAKSRAKLTSPQALRQAFQLYRAIQKKYGIPPTRRNGLEFLPFGDFDWRVPPGECRELKLGLEIRNVSGRPIRVPTPGAVQMYLSETDRKCFGFTGVIRASDRSGLRRTEGVVIDKGQSLRLEEFGGWLWRRVGESAATFESKDRYPPTSYPFAFKPLAPGSYYLNFAIQSTDPRLLLDDVRPHLLLLSPPFADPPPTPLDPPFWTGEVWTVPVAVEIR